MARRTRHEEQAGLRTPWQVSVGRTRISVDGTSLRLTNPDKQLWPAEGITKLDLARYYLAVAPYALPYVADRPITIQSFPQGIAERSIFVKRRPRGTPAWVKGACLPAVTEPTLCYVVAEDAAAGAATLAWLANRASIPVHIWLSRADRPRKPDWLAFDLDPAEGATFAQVVRLARWLRDRLGEMNLQSYVKVSGSRGLHVLAHQPQAIMGMSTSTPAARPQPSQGGLGRRGSPVWLGRRGGCRVPRGRETARAEGR